MKLPWLASLQQFCTKNCTFHSCLSLCIPNDASHIDEETESHAEATSDFVICMIRVHWFLGIVRYSLLNIPVEICPICLVENSHVNLKVGWIPCQSGVVSFLQVGTTCSFLGSATCEASSDTSVAISILPNSTIQCKISIWDW